MCEKEQVYDEADVEFDPYEAEGLPDGPGSEEYERAVKHVVEMFGGTEKVPGYMHPGKEEKGQGDSEMGGVGGMMEDIFISHLDRTKGRRTVPHTIHNYKRLWWL
jgi:hypothetical protein